MGFFQGKSVLLTGGSGLLGTELKRHGQFFAPPHRVFDILKTAQGPEVDAVVHAAAYTGVEAAETNRMECLDLNVRGTQRMLDMYRSTPFVYISTEYAHNPVNFYGLTKSLAEQLVTYHPAPYLIIRTLFKPKPWPWPKAFRDQWTLGGYLPDVAKAVYEAIDRWDGKPRLMYVGHGGRKTMYDLALETRPDVIPNSVSDIKGVKIPHDYQ